MYDLSMIYKTMDQCPILDKETEYDLFVQYREHNSLAARSKLINHNLRFVLYVASGYSSKYGTIEDLFQEGVYGLLKSVDKFDYHSGHQLATYAKFHIRSEIVSCIRKNSFLGNALTTKSLSKLFFNLNKYKTENESYTLDQLEQISTDLNVPITDVKFIEQLVKYGDFSIHQQSDDNEYDMEFTAPLSYDPMHILMSSETPDMDDIIHSLNDREKIIFNRRYNTEESATKSQLAKEFGISCERVSQLEKQMFKKIKPKLEDYV